MEALNGLCAGKEGCVQDALQMKDAVSLAEHQKALSAIMQQLAETENKLQAERALCENAHAELARLKSDLQDARHGMMSKEEHERIMVRVEDYIAETLNISKNAHFYLKKCPLSFLTLSMCLSWQSFVSLSVLDRYT